LRYVVDLYLDTTWFEYRPGYRLPSGSEYFTRYSDTLQAERSGIESLWGRDFPNHSWSPPSLLHNAFRV